MSVCDERLEELVIGTRDAIEVRLSAPLLSFERDDIEDLLRVALTRSRDSATADHAAALSALTAALREIAHDPHCAYSEPGQYGIGVADGHRCAAMKARKALGEEVSE